MSGRRSYFILMLVLVFILSPVSAEEMGEGWLQEKIGSLQYGMKEGKVVQILGKPEKAGESEFHGATGDYVKSWDYPYKGVFLTLFSLSKKGEFAVASITIKSPCGFKTSRGVGVGSTYEEVLKAYAHMEKSPLNSDPNRIIIGTFEGGIIFTFKDNKVIKIFIGCATE